MSAMGIIFANSENPLGALTDKRTKSAVPFGGRYRQIDFTLSNMTNSGIRRIGIISRTNFQSLMAHIGSGEEWDLEVQEGGLEFISPYSMGNYGISGNVEALNFALDYLKYGGHEDYVIMAGANVLCNINLAKVLQAHIDSGKDITVVTKSGIADGVKKQELAVKLNGKGEITDMAVDYAASEEYAVSTGIYVVAKELLRRLVKEAAARNLYNFHRDIVLSQYQAGTLTVGAYQFGGVAMYNTTVEEYFRNSMAILDKDVRHDLFSGNHPIFTKVRDRVPSYYGENCHIENCTVADGCFLEGTVRHSVLFRQVSVAENAEVEDCVIMNDTVVGENCYLKDVILDKNVTVRPGTKLIGTPTCPIVIKRGDTV